LDRKLILWRTKKFHLSRNKKRKFKKQVLKEEKLKLSKLKNIEKRQKHKKIGEIINNDELKLFISVNDDSI
jgi:hypothetical protein